MLNKTMDNLYPKIIITLCIIVICSHLTSASPAMPVLGINDETMECAEFFMGDECLRCELPEGWVDIGNPYDNECPEGYAKVQGEAICKPLKNDFCCTVSHSGLNGNCEDVIVNDAEKKCAFVEDITECDSLPPGWTRAEEDEFWGRVCPSWEYGWLDGYLECGNPGTTIPTTIPDNQETTIPISPPDDQEDTTQILLAGAVLVFLSLIVWGIYAKSK